MVFLKNLRQEAQNDLEIPVVGKGVLKVCGSGHQVVVTIKCCTEWDPLTTWSKSDGLALANLFGN